MHSSATTTSSHQRNSNSSRKGSLIKPSKHSITSSTSSHSNNHSTLASYSTNIRSTRSTRSTRSSSTPLAALADKFDRFKKRMSNSSKKERVRRSRSPYDETHRHSYSQSHSQSHYRSLSKSKKTNSSNSNSNSSSTNSTNGYIGIGVSSNSNTSNKLKPTPEKYRVLESMDNRNNPDSSSSNRRYYSSSMDIEREAAENSNSNINLFNQFVDGVNKMAPTSRDDATAVTFTSSTQPSYSHDESTIVSEDTSYTYHSFQAGKEQFTVDKRYKMIRTIGSGAYGVVISAEDVHKSSSSSSSRSSTSSSNNSNHNVAIKMVPRAFHDEVDAKRILREIKLLKHFHHENIISILDMMPPLARNVENFNDVYIVTDLMETDLHRIIYSKQSLSLDHVQYFLYQVLRALKYMHSANVLHRDLKPSNLLVNSNCDLKVCDFGLARGISDTHDFDLQNGGGSMLLTEYVVTRWYRAPEIMLACHEYSKPSDIWSVGCIFAELLGRKPFFPGDDYIDQLTIISEKLGKLPEEDLDFVTSEKAKRFMRKLPNKQPTPLSKLFPNANAEAIDLLRKMLVMHPRKRIDVVGALEHPFFSSLHNPKDEPVAHSSFDFSFEDEKLDRLRLKELIWKEIGDFRPSCLPVPPREDRSQRGSFCNRLYST